MKTVVSASRPVVDMAEKIRVDLVLRGLKPGDRYLTSEQAQRLFKVRKSLINRSMQLLAEQNVLVRQRRAGTFVGEGFQAVAEAGVGETSLEKVHVLMAMDYYRARVISAERFVSGIGAALPRATVQIHYVPEEKALSHAQEVIDAIKAGSGSEAVVLIRSQREVQLLVEQSGVAAIVFGSVYPGIKLPSLDVDQVRAAELSVRYAVKRGRRKFFLLMRDQWRQGDNLLLRGITAELSRAGVGLDSVDVASLPPHEHVIRHELQQRLADAESLAVLCRGTFAARPAVETVREAGLQVGRDVDVIDLQGSLEEAHQCPTVVADWGYHEQITSLAKELRRVAEGGEAPLSAICVPVSLVDEQGQRIAET